MNVFPDTGVAQLGARMHYAVPAAFAQAGRLRAFCTDLWAPALPTLIRKAAGKLMPALEGRTHLALRRAPVFHQPMLAAAYARALRRARNRSEQTAAFLTWSSRFATAAAPHLAGCRMVYGFNSAFLELAEALAGRTFLAVEQTLVPRAVERTILAGIPGYPDDAHTLAYEAREFAEWNAAHLVVCGSEFVRAAVAGLGIAPEKLVVVPYGVSLPRHARTLPPYDGQRPLKLLFAGNGALRKGLPDLLEAVESLGSSVELTVAGSLQLPDGFSLPPVHNARYLGPVNRSRMPALYAAHDVFVFPSLCEGSATVTYEALQSGLPVVCTPNTGSVVTDGHDGFLVPVVAPGLLAAAIRKFVGDPDLLSAMSAAAFATGSAYSEPAYGARLLDALDRARREAGYAS